MTRITVDGVEIACDWRPNPSATRSVVFLHGWMDSMADSARNAPALATTFNVLRFDLPGHGSSGPAARYSVEGYAAAARGVIDRFAPVGPVLIGHSMGAMLAAELHRAQPWRWAGVILLDPPLRGSSLVRFWQPFAAAGRATGLLPVLADRLRRSGPLATWWCDVFDGAASDRTAFARAVTRHGLRTTDRQAIAQGLADIAANRMVLARPPDDAPFVVVHGEDDPTFDAKKAAAWFPPERVHAVAGTRHAPNRVAVDEVNALLARLASGAEDR